MLLVDTGGGATLITPDVAERLGCEPYGRDVGHRMSGERVEFKRCDGLELASGSWRRRMDEVAVFDVNALLPDELPSLDGVLALDAFRGDVVTIDWPAAMIIVDTTGSTTVAPAGLDLPVRLATGVSGRMLSAFVRVDSSRGFLWLLLDSGNIRGTLLSKQLLEDELLDTPSEGNVTLRFGDRPPTTMPFEADDLIIDGVLGTSFLMEGPLKLDLRRWAAPPNLNN